MHIEQRYHLTTKALQRGHRYQIPLSGEEILEIKQALYTDHPKLLMALCLLQNTSSFLPELENHLINLLRETKDSQSLIHSLHAFRRHVIEGSRRQSKRLDITILTELKNLLSHPDWEVKEWVVRTIDDCGSQSIYFKDELLKIYPNKFQILLSKHKRHTRGMIDLLIMRWRL